jgi:hypothetical protein
MHALFTLLHGNIISTRIPEQPYLKVMKVIAQAGRIRRAMEGER